MRPVIIAVSAAAIAGTITTAAANPCCRPNAVYGTPPYTISTPPTGYVLDPSDAVNPAYVVNRGPVLTGPGIYSYTNPYISTFDRPSYSEGGYIYPDTPYYRWSKPHAYPCAYPYARTGYGWGCGGYRYSGCGGAHYHHHLAYRPYGHPPYAAYRHRPAPGPRVMHIPSKGY